MPDPIEPDPQEPQEPVEPETLEVVEPEPQEPAEPEELSAFAKAKIDKANREAKNLRDRLREAEPVLEAARAAEEAQKSESQRLQERAENAERERDQLRRGQLVADAASDAKLPKKLWKFVTGDSQDDIDAQIADLLDGIPQPAEPPVDISGKPRENLRGGGRPDEEPEESDPKKIVAKIPRSFR